MLSFFQLYSLHVFSQILICTHHIWIKILINLDDFYQFGHFDWFLLRVCMNNLWILDNILRKGERKGKEQDIEKEKKGKQSKANLPNTKTATKHIVLVQTLLFMYQVCFFGVINHYTTLYVLVLVVAALAVALALAPAVGVAVVGVAFVVVVVVA